VKIPGFEFVFTKMMRISFQLKSYKKLKKQDYVYYQQNAINVCRRN